MESPHPRVPQSRRPLSHALRSRRPLRECLCPFGLLPRAESRRSQRKTNAIAAGFPLKTAKNLSFWLRLGALCWLCVFSPIFFIFFLPSFAFSSLQQPSFAFIGEGSERGFGGGFGRPTRAAWAGWSRVTVWRSADFQICRVAGFQTRRPQGRGAGLEAGDTAGWETCATQPRQVRAQQIRSRLGPAGGGIDRAYVSHA